MNKKKLLQLTSTIEELLDDEMNKKERCKSELYIKTWIIGTINQIKFKAMGENITHWTGAKYTYKELFNELDNYYRGINCNPAIVLEMLQITHTQDIMNLMSQLKIMIYSK